MASSKKPLIGITMGDPGGIGGEVALKALANSLKTSRSHFVLLGYFKLWKSLAKKFYFKPSLVWVNDAELGRDVKRGVAVLDLGGVKKVQWGKVTASQGAAASCSSRASQFECSAAGFWAGPVDMPQRR